MSVLQAYMQGRQARQAENQMMRQNMMQQYVQANAGGIFSGDKGALSGLAQYDPMMALDIQGRHSNERRANAAEGRAAEAHNLRLDEYKRGLSKEQAAQDAAELRQAVQLGLAAQTPEQFDQLMAQQPETQQYVGQFENRKQIAQGFLDIADQLEMMAAPKGTDDMREYEFARSQGYQGSFEQWTSGKNRALGGIDDRQEVNVGEAYNPADVVSTIGLLDSIFTSPSLGRITGPIQGGGGNDVDDLNMIQRLMAGPEGLATIEKINQVQSRGWLAARDMLKGGGPITDYESRKAEAAVARMSRAKGEDEFKSALREFREAIADGVKKLQDAGMAPADLQIPPAPWVEQLEAEGPAQAATPAPPAPTGYTQDEWQTIWDLMPEEDRKLFQ